MSDTFDPTASGAPEDQVFEVDIDLDLPEAGTYMARVTGLTKKESQSGNPMWVWTFTLLEGKAAGKTVTLFTALTSAAAWRLVQVVRALGVGADKGKVKFSREEIMNRPCLVTVEHQNYNGETRAAVGKVLPVPSGQEVPEAPQVPF